MRPRRVGNRRFKVTRWAASISSASNRTLSSPAPWHTAVGSPASARCRMRAHNKRVTPGRRLSSVGPSINKAPVFSSSSGHLRRRTAVAAASCSTWPLSTVAEEPSTRRATLVFPTPWGPNTIRTGRRVSSFGKGRRPRYSLLVPINRATQSISWIPLSKPRPIASCASRKTPRTSRPSVPLAVLPSHGRLLPQELSNSCHRSPRREDFRHPSRLQSRSIRRRNDPSRHDKNIVKPAFTEREHHLWQEPVVCPGQNREPYRVHVLLERSLCDLQSCSVQTRVHHLKPFVAQATCHHLGPAVMSIQTGLGHQDPNSLRCAHDRKLLAMTRRWISLVPSYRVVMRASR